MKTADEAIDKGIKLPSTLLIVGLVLIFVILLTWIVPAGEFQKTTHNGQQIIVAGSYQRTETHPQGIGALLTAPVKGFISAAQIIGFVLILGGVFSILTKSGAIESSLQSVVKLCAVRPAYKKAFIPFLMTLFSLAGATYGMSEEVLLFILITIPFSWALGYDTIVGVAIPFVGAGAGFAGALTNPFTIGIAQGIAELPLFSGWEYRILVWFALTITAILFVMRYAGKLDKKIVVRVDEQRTYLTTEIQPLNLSRKIVVTLFISTIVLLIIGVNTWDWYINEITGLYLALGIVTVLLARIKREEAVSAFIAGAKGMLPAGLVIGLSKSILIVATDGKIIDTILYHLSGALHGFHPLVSAELMFVVQNVLHFAIPSGSGQAALTMPIMAPLGDLLDISRQTVVLIFQLGDGIGSMIMPTSGVTMGVLTAAKIPYTQWVKWIWPHMVIFFILSLLLLIPPMVMFDYK